MDDGTDGRDDMDDGTDGEDDMDDGTDDRDDTFYAPEVDTINVLDDDDEIMADQNDEAMPVLNIFEILQSPFVEEE